jgi:hypothetical protein
MDQTEQPRGNFIAFMNRDKKPGDRRPAFDGRIALPGSDEERRLALWAHTYTDPKTGEVKTMFSGQAGNVVTNATALDQIAALSAAPVDEQAATVGNLQLAAGQIVVFPNGFKAEAPDKDRPDFWGAFNPGDGSAVVRLSVWAKKDRNDNVVLTGATSYPMPGKSEAEQQAAQADLGRQVAQGAMAGGAKTKGGRGGRG